MLTQELLDYNEVKPVEQKGQFVIARGMLFKELVTLGEQEFPKLHEFARGGVSQ